MCEWSPELHRNLFQEHTTCGEWSKELHAKKHKNKNSLYEDNVQDYIAQHLSPDTTRQLNYDLEPPYSRSPSAPRSTRAALGPPRCAMLRPNSVCLDPHARPGSPAWLPPYMKSPPNGVASPGVRGVAHLTSEQMERTGGGFVQEGLKQMNCRQQLPWGPPIGSAPRAIGRRQSTVPARLKPAPHVPSFAERALWMQGPAGRFPRSMGLNTRKVYDRPRESMHLISTESGALFDEVLPLNPDGSNVRILSAASQQQFPIRRPMTSKDFYRLYQFVSGEPSCVM